MGNDNNSMEGSIFNDPALKAEFTQPIMPVEPPSQPAVNVMKFFDSLVNKLVDEPKQKGEIKKLSKEGAAMLQEHEEVLKIFYEFGCNIVLRDGEIEIECPPINVVGIITVHEDGTTEFDDATNQIMEYLSKMIVGSNNMNISINKYEDEGFYPVGELEKVVIKYKGQDVEALCGILQNDQGQTKKIYYYKGKEVTPD